MAAADYGAAHQKKVPPFCLLLHQSDPLLSARSAIYSQSFTRRAGEKKEPSAITHAEVQK